MTTGPSLLGNSPTAPDPEPRRGTDDGLIMPRGLARTDEMREAKEMPGVSGPVRYGLVTTVIRRGFAWYAARYLRRHMHAVRIATDTEAHLVNPPGPIVVLVNHPSWWDPLVGAFLQDRYWPDRDPKVPMDAAALAKYPLFSRLGAFGVELDSPRGVKQFLTEASAHLARPEAVLWITAQGRFTDVRQRTALRPGLAHLLSRMTRGTVLPLAIEYAFWEERTGEVLLEVGTPLAIGAPSEDQPPQGETPSRAEIKAAWQTRLETALGAAQDRLAEKVIARDAAAFTTLLSGQSGVGGVYDLFRRFAAGVTGRRFVASHGDGR